MFARQILPAVTGPKCFLLLSTSMSTFGHCAYILATTSGSNSQAVHHFHQDFTVLHPQPRLASSGSALEDCNYSDDMDAICAAIHVVRQFWYHRSVVSDGVFPHHLTGTQVKFKEPELKLLVRCVCGPGSTLQTSAIYATFPRYLHNWVVSKHYN
ncbi:hypothetical protein B0H17DRAFT_1148456 [Mycena rosella]|uniref:Uncharacterized protein n=1 Tax=Mycena rosella TaxID=1033263 RepID=A0AAD7FZ92_MYCRO|nr:hypothetical protein B0H17DRAFT_1148456 [Mycena rosella]